MSNVKRKLRLSVLGLASLCLIGGSGFLLCQNQALQAETSSAITDGVISNSTPDFFQAKWLKGDATVSDLKQSSTPTVYSSSASDKINLNFSTVNIPELRNQEEKTNNEDKTVYVSDYKASDGTWSGKIFNFSGFSLKRNGVPVAISEVDPNNPKYISNQTSQNKFQSGTISSQAFDLDIVLNPLAESDSVSDKTLSLTKEGVYEITIPYSAFVTEDGEVFDSEPPQAVTFEFVLVSQNSYLDGTYAANTTPYNFEMTTVSADATVDYAYFFNYTSKDLPSLSYDYKRFNLNVKKSFNLSSSSVFIAYDQELENRRPGSFVSSYKDTDLFDLTLNGNSCQLYFKDLGNYTISFEPIYITENKTYVLPNNIGTRNIANDQNVFMFGYQSTYTKFDQESNKNTYPEFKTFDDNHKVVDSADVTEGVLAHLAEKTENSLTTFVNDATVTPVSTNQVPVKFVENAKLNESQNKKMTLYKVSSSASGKTLDAGTVINASKNISNAGTYLVEVIYTFDDYVTSGYANPNATFKQYFYFEIKNQTPTVEVFADILDTSLAPETYSFSEEKQSLSSNEYSNKNVYIKNVFEANDFDSDVIIEIYKYDFLTKRSSVSNLLTDFTSYNITVDGKTEKFYEISDNGNYTINIYYGREGKNGTPVTRKFNIDKTDISEVQAFGVQNAGTNYYRTATEVESLTNQPLIFTWEVEKESGAKTYGYYKYFPLNDTASLTAITTSQLDNFVNENIIPVDYELDLNANGSWIQYNNARVVQNTTSISSSYVRSGAGLYVLYIYDEAGNETSKVYMLDNTKPNFVLKKIDQSNNSSTEFLTDYVTISQDCTVLWGDYKVFKVKGNATDLQFNGNAISAVTDAYDTFKSNYVKTYNSLTSSFKGDYFKVKINDKVLFKDLLEKYSDYKLVEMNQLEIVSSYSLYYIVNDDHSITYYFSTTTSEYIKLNLPPDNKNAYATGEHVWLDSTERAKLKFYGDEPIDGTNYMPVVNIEGSYSILLRDESNTVGGNLVKDGSIDEIALYRDYSSASQYIDLTSDASLLTLAYGSDLKPLLSASYASYTEGPVGDKTKYAFYEPSNIDEKLYVTFVPRIENGDNLTQVSSVNLKYYNFTVESQTYFKNGQANTTFIRTLEKEPSFNQDIYRYDGTSTSTEKIILEVNIQGESVCKEGMYVITRTYFDEGDYSVDKYDFKTRVLNTIVDKQNVISESEAVEIETTVCTANVEGNTETFYVNGKVLTSSLNLDGEFYVKANETLDNQIDSISSETKEINGKIYYSYEFPRKVESIKLYKNGTPISLSEPVIEKSVSTQSIIGAGMLISTFAGTSDSIEYPRFQDMPETFNALNYGYTFYTERKSGYTKEIEIPDYITNNISTRFSTNKVPVKLYIPEFKYTLQSRPTDGNGFEIEEYENLSYFKGTSTEIDFNKLCVQVFFQALDKLEKIAVSNDAENGYLTFVDLQGNEVKEFTAPGNYYVVVTQANSAPAMNESSFKANYIFGFEIKQTAPEFILLSGDGTILEGNETTKTFYTNKDKLNVTWYDFSSEYMANIDSSAIEIKSNVDEYTLEINKISKTVVVKNSKGVEIDGSAFSFKREPLFNDRMYSHENSLMIDLAMLGVYENEKTLSISMQFENPGNLTDFFKQTTQTLVIDTSIFNSNHDPSGAPIYTTILDELFEKISEKTTSLSLNDLRECIDINGNLTSDKSKTTYGQSRSSGVYKYYSYQVDKEFFKSLIQRINSNLSENSSATTSAYFRKVENLYDGSFVETQYNNFIKTSSSYKKMDSQDNLPNEQGYYEIIECDYAGNILVYLVHLFDKDEQKSECAVTYFDKQAGEISNEEIESCAFTVYGSTSLVIENIDFYKDDWAFIRVQDGDGVSTRFMKSPWLGNKLYNISLSTFEEVDYRSILGDSKSLYKTYVYISDRSNNEICSFAVARSNTSEINITSTEERDGIVINLPSVDVVKASLITSFPVQIDIKTSGSTAYYDRDYPPFINDPNKNVLTSGYSYNTYWNSTSQEDIIVSYNSANNTLVVKFDEIPRKNTKIRYTVTDNFGKTHKAIYVVGTDFEQSSDYTGYLYSNYDESGLLHYYTQNTFSYKFNERIYNVNIFDVYGNQIQTQEDFRRNFISTNSLEGITTYRFSCPTQQTDLELEVMIFDREDDSEPINHFFVHLYKVLPELNGALANVRFVDENANDLKDKFTVLPSKITLGGKEYNCYEANAFATILTVSYTNPQYFAVPYQGYVYRNGEFEPFDSGDKFVEDINENSSVYYIMFKYTSDELMTNEYVLYRIELINSSTNFFYVSVNGEVIPQEKTGFNQTYSNYYMVNVPYSQNSLVKIETNQYQQVRPPELYGAPIYNGRVATCVYHLTNKTEFGVYPAGVSPYDDYVAITYIPSTTQPLTNLRYISESGEPESLLNKTSHTIIAGKESNFDTLKIIWNKYYGISQNTLYVVAEKDGKKIDLETSTEGDYFYTLIDISGTYKLYFKDHPGNTQHFGDKDYLEITFLKDVYFTMISQDPNGEEIETEPIDRGIFNGKLKLVLKNIDKYYTTASVGTGEKTIHALRNGEEFTDYEFDPEKSTFIFSKPGFYQVYFSATANNGSEEGIPLREQVYTFTIINPNEIRYAFEFSSFKKYRIENVIRDNGVKVQEITSIGGESVKGNSKLLVSFYDQETGAGLYTVTINTNRKLILGSEDFTSFTFSFLIRHSVPPIIVSANEGSTTTAKIQVSFNPNNIYNAVGDCRISVLNDNQVYASWDLNEETASTIGEQNLEITSAGTYFIQVHTESGNLLYSYKVVKKDPLNGWAIAAIVIGSIVAVAIVIIVIKLRKRIKTK